MEEQDDFVKGFYIGCALGAFAWALIITVIFWIF